MGCKYFPGVPKESLLIVKDIWQRLDFGAQLQDQNRIVIYFDFAGYNRNNNFWL